jgi:hypothetical protein
MTGPFVQLSLPQLVALLCAHQPEWRAAAGGQGAAAHGFKKYQHIKDKTFVHSSARPAAIGSRPPQVFVEVPGFP